MASQLSIRSPHSPTPAVVGDGLDICNEQMTMDMMNNDQFHRSLNRVYYESDYSTPTSWEFRILPNIPQYDVSSSFHCVEQLRAETPTSNMSAAGIGLNIRESINLANKSNHTISPTNSPLLHQSQQQQSQILVNVNSRNSTGSSAGSHKSQDSGFSDYGEGGRRSRRSNKTKKALSSPPPLVEEQTTVIYPENFYQSKPDNEFSPNYYQELIYQSIKSNANETPPCTTSSYHSPCSNERIPEEFGAPTFCSTPKKPQSNFSPRLSLNLMKKIDNFESLNKNKNTNELNNNCIGNGHRSILSVYEENHTSLSRSENRPPSRPPPPPPPPRDSSTGLSLSSLNFNLNSPFITGIKSQSDNFQSKRNSISSSHIIPSSSSSTGSRPKENNYHHRHSYSLSRFPSRNYKHQLQNPVNALTVLPLEGHENGTNNGESSSRNIRMFDKNSVQYQSLPKGYKRVLNPNNPNEEPRVVQSHIENGSMRQWLHQLRVKTESEPLTALQTKSLRQFLPSDESDLDFLPSFSLMAVSSPLMSIRNIERMASLISDEFSRICKHLELGMFKQVPQLISSLVDHIERLLFHFQENFGNLGKVENHLVTSCYELRVTSETLREILDVRDDDGEPIYPDTSVGPFRGEIGSESQAVVGLLVERVVVLGNLFSQVIDQRLKRDLASLLDTIEAGGIAGRIALHSYAIVLADGGTHMCRLASEIRTVRALLGAFLDANEDTEKQLAFRCLATILCIGEAVKDFDKAGGFEIVADVLFESSYSIGLKFEAVAVLTQSTDPWIDLETTLGNLGIHLEKIIYSLTYMIHDSVYEQDSFLLVVAALSNLTFLEVISIEILRHYKTLPLIIEAVCRKTDYSIFILDHVATIIANMSASESCRNEIVCCGGIETLLTFLRKSPIPFQFSSEIAACERLQQKSTIAISRLCSEPFVVQRILEMDGVRRFIQLTREEKERNYSDGVLIACLATLRKLVTVAGNEVIQGLNAEDLIQPRLLDSFLLFSSRQESYV